MNKRLRQNFLTGLAAIVGVGALVFGILWLRNTLSFGRNTHYVVVFDDVKGLSAGSLIQMAGVSVGKVDAVGLTRDLPGFPDNKARLDVSINAPYQIPQGSQFLIKSPPIGSVNVLTITPNPQTAPTIPNNTVLAGVATAGLDDVIAQSQPLLGDAQKLLASLNRSTDAVGKFATDEKVQRDLRITLRKTAEASESLPRLLRQSERQLSVLSAQTEALLIKVNRAADSGQKIAVNAEGLTGDLRLTLNENRSGLRSLIQNTSETASSFAGLADNLASTVGNQDLQKNLVVATKNLADITSRLDATAADLNRLSSDPRLSDDVRQTVSTVRETADNLRQTTVSVRNLAARVETIRIPGERRRTPTASTQTTPSPDSPPRAPARFSDTSLLEPGLVLDAVYDTTLSRLRVDTNFTLLAGKPGSFYRLGIYDLTERNRFNLQVGTSNRLPANFALRYGIFAGKLGTGIDFRTGPVDLRLDAYDPNRFTLNARAKAYLNADSSITAGVDSIGKENRATVGVQIRR